MTSEASPAGSAARTGAMIGAVCRPVIVSTFWLRDQRSVEPWITVLVSSLLIGASLGWVVGRIAGLIRNPVIGSVWGAICGATLGLVSSLFTIFFLCMETYQPHNGRDINVGLYLAAMACAAALPGIAGGLVGHRVRQTQAALSAAEANEETDRPGDGPFDSVP
jgi:hypothetical protein